MKVKAKTLDSLLKKHKINKVDLIKIDVEGAERDVLFGAKETLKKHPKILFEAWDKDFLDKIKSVLNPYKYKVISISDTYYLAY